MNLTLKNANGDMVMIEITRRTGIITGDMDLGDRVFEIVSPAKMIHVLVEVDVNNLPEDSDPVEHESPRELTMLDRAMLLQGELDRQTTVTVSIKVYYTPQARQRNSNIL